MKIKANILLFAGIMGAFLPSSASVLEYEEPMALCIGSVVFNTGVNPDLCLYYKGNKLQLDINRDEKPRRIGQQVSTKQELVRIVPYTLSEAKSTQRFHLLICSRPQFASYSNTVTYLHVPEAVPYKFYTLSGARQRNENSKIDGCLWSVTQENLLEDRKVPDNTIVFLFNADYVEELEVKPWPLHSNIRLLPNIIMKKTISEQDIARAIAEARMVSLDFATVHEHDIKNMTKIESKTILTLKS